MAAYTFICRGRDGAVGAFEAADCDDDWAAVAAARRLFIESPTVRDWPGCRRIEVYEADRLVGEVERAAAGA
jgi:hypothetical protein